MCKESELVKLGYVALDGTKGKGNASTKHKYMSYCWMMKKGQELALEVEKLLKEAEALDEKDGKGKRGDELPDELQFKKTRLEKMR